MLVKTANLYIQGWRRIIIITFITIRCFLSFTVRASTIKILMHGMKKVTQVLFWHDISTRKRWQNYTQTYMQVIFQLKRHKNPILAWHVMNTSNKNNHSQQESCMPASAYLSELCIEFQAFRNTFNDGSTPVSSRLYPEQAAYFSANDT